MKIVHNGHNPDVACTGNLTAGWPSDLHNGTNVSHCSTPMINSKWNTGSGWSTCANRTFDAYSYAGF